MASNKDMLSRRVHLQIKVRCLGPADQVVPGLTSGSKLRRTLSSGAGFRRWIETGLATLVPLSSNRLSSMGALRSCVWFRSNGSHWFTAIGHHLRSTPSKYGAFLVALDDF
jgi:hypothetical protein